MKLRDLLLQWNIDEFRSYIDSLENSLQQNLDEFSRKSEEELKKYADHPNFVELGIIMENDYWQLEERFPRILRNSFLITSHFPHPYDLISCQRYNK